MNVCILIKVLFKLKWLFLIYLTALTPSPTRLFFLKMQLFNQTFFYSALINLFSFLLISDLKINIDKVMRMRIFGSISYTNALKSTDLQGFW